MQSRLHKAHLTSLPLLTATVTMKVEFSVSRRRRVSHHHTLSLLSHSGAFFTAKIKGSGYPVYYGLGIQAETASHDAQGPQLLMKNVLVCQAPAHRQRTQSKLVRRQARIAHLTSTPSPAAPARRSLNFLKGIAGASTGHNGGGAASGLLPCPQRQYVSQITGIPTQSAGWTQAR